MKRNGVRNGSKGIRRMLAVLMTAGILLQQTGVTAVEMADTAESSAANQADSTDMILEGAQTSAVEQPESTAAVVESIQTSAEIQESAEIQTETTESIAAVTESVQTSVEIQTEESESTAAAAESIQTSAEIQTEEPESTTAAEESTQQSAESETEEPESTAAAVESIQTSVEIQTEESESPVTAEESSQQLAESETEEPESTETVAESTQESPESQAAEEQSVQLYCEGVVQTDTFLYASPKEDSQILQKVPAGTIFLGIQQVQSASGKQWIKIVFDLNEIAYEGFVLSEALSVKRSSRTLRVSEIESFPESYQSKLLELQQEHPNWVFQPVFVEDTYDYAVSQQMEPARALVSMYYHVGFRSLLERDYSWKTDSWKQWEPGWAGASEATVRYYMDPRNFLDETEIFMFEALTYEAYQTEDAVEAVLNNSFMSHTNVPGEEYTYAWLFVWIGQKYNINPVSLASRVRQEQGAGTSELISGTYPGYEGLYNYFNLQATGSTRAEIVTNGLKEAQRGSTMTLPDNTISQGAWDTPAKALIGGAMKFASQYILRNQNTLYAQKFDYDPAYNGTYWHQYMTNIMAPYSEGGNVGRSYRSIGMEDEPFVFLIPVYNQMPAESPMPQERKHFNSCLQSLTVNGQELITEFDRNQKEFTCMLSEETDFAGVMAIASSAEATVFYRNPGAMEYSVSVCDILVTAEDETTSTYRLVLSKGIEVPEGFFEGFDVNSYRRRYPSLEQIYGDNLDGYYEHYLKIGYGQGWNGAPDGQTEDSVVYPTVYQGVNYAVVYQMDYYLEHYPDVRAAFGSNPELVLAHFVNYGISEGRCASPDFDVTIYQKNYLDLRRIYGEDRLKYVQHYINHGILEGRNGRQLLYLSSNGLQEDEYGVWHYYVNGVIQDSYTGLAQQDNRWYYICDGVLQEDFSGMLQIGTRQYYISAGIWENTLCGLVDDGGELYYLENGIVNDAYAGLTNYQTEWYYVSQGAVDYEYTGLTEFCGAWYYVQDGVLKWGYNALVPYRDHWYYVENSMIQWNRTGLVKRGESWVYVENSVMQSNYTGAVMHNNVLYYVSDGMLCWDYTGLVSYQNSLYFMRNSMHQTTYTGLVQYQNIWYFVRQGAVDTAYLGLVRSGNNLYYIRDGKIDWNYNGTAVFGGTSYQVQTGMVRL